MNSTIITLLLFVIAVFIILIIRLLNNKRRRRDREELLQLLDKDPFEYQYFIAGHPDLQYNYAYNMKIADGKLHIVTLRGEEHGEIPLDSIERVSIRDCSTYETGRSFSSVFFLDIWAYLLLKDKKEEIFRLTINWENEGKTLRAIFEYLGDFAGDRANVACETLQKALKNN